MSEPNALLNTTVGNYRIVKEIGAGAMGEVFLAEHPQIGSKVAVKVLSRQLSSNPDMAQRFLSEARAANQINHPNIIKVVDFGQLPDERLYLTMEFLSGQELTEHINEHAPLSIGETRRLLQQISGAMDAAHREGIIHRDLKPDNIFLHEAGGERVVKILDFGIAKLTQGDMGGAQKTSTGMIMGTPLYMSPEQAAGMVGDISPQSDIYAIGVILYQMLSSHLPIQGPTAAQILAGHIASPPIPLGWAAANLPEALAAVLDRCLQKQPADRFESATALFEAFEEAVSGVPDDLRATPLEPPSAAAGAMAYGSQPGLGSQPAGMGSGVGSLAATSQGGRPSPSGLGSGAGSSPGFTPQEPSLERPLPEPLDAPKRRRWLWLGGVVGLLVAGLAALLVLHPWSRGGSSSSAAEAEQTPAPRPRHAEPRPRRVRPRTPRVRPRPAKVTVRVRCRTRWARVTAKVGADRAQTKKPPFAIAVPAGTSIVLEARRRGYAPRRVEIVAQSDREVDLTLARRGHHATSRTHPRTRTRPRVRTRPRHHVPSMRRVGAGTLRLD